MFRQAGFVCLIVLVAALSVGVIASSARGQTSSAPLPLGSASSLALRGQPSSGLQRSASGDPKPTIGQRWALQPGVPSLPAKRGQGAAAVRLSRKMASSASPSSGVCFQPGIGWVRPSSTDQVSTSAFQSIPLSMGASLAAAKQMPQPADPEACSDTSPNAAIPSAIRRDLAGSGGSPVDQASALAGSEQQSGADSSSPESAALAAQSVSMMDSSTGQLAFTLSSESQSGLVHLRTSVTAGGTFIMSVVPSAQPITRVGDFAAQLNALGQPVSSLDAVQGTFAAHVEVMPNASFRLGTTGLKPSSSFAESAPPTSGIKFPRMGTKTSGSGIPGGMPGVGGVSGSIDEEPGVRQIHAYETLRKRCEKVVQAEQRQSEGPMSQTSSNAGLLSSHQSEELRRLRTGCTEFLAMSRNHALKEMARHRESR